MKKYLIINHHAPLYNLYTEEVLELTLSIASLDNLVSILLLEDAGLLLLDLNLQLINRSLLHQTIEALKLFNLDNIYVEDIILDKFNKANLPILQEYKYYVKSFNWKQLSDLYNTHDIILNFNQ